MPASRSVLLLSGVCLLLGAGLLPAQTPYPQSLSRPYSVTQWGHREGLPSSTIYAIAQTRDGYLWLGTADGLIRFDGTRFEQMPLSARDDVSFGQVRALLVSGDGALWIGTDNGTVARMWAGAMRFRPVGAPVLAIREAEGSGIDVRTPRTVYRFAPSTLTVFSSCDAKGDAGGPCAGPFAPKLPGEALAAAREPASDVADAIRDGHGDLWLASRQRGLFRWSPADAAVEHISTIDGLSSNAVWTVFRDREDNLWAGTQNGLNRLRSTRFSALTRSSGQLWGDLHSIAAAGGALYAGSALGLDRLTEAGVATVLREPVLALASGEGGAPLLAGTPRGILAIDGERSRLLPVGVAARQVTALAASRGGAVFFFDRQGGLYRWAGGGRAAKFALPAGEKGPVSVMRADRRGGLWVAFASGTVAYWREGAFQVVKAAGEDGLPDGRLHFISIDADGGVWIASDGGLALFSQGRFKAWTKRNGLPGNRVLWAVRGGDGRLWLGYNIGVASVALADLRKAETRGSYRMPVDFYDEGDGLRSSPELKGNEPVAVLPDGRIWLTTAEGLATADPAHMLRNEVPPIADVVSVTADDRAMDARGAVLLPKRTRRLEIGYAGLSFAEPTKVSFRYRLAGFDEAWHEVGDRRFATYTNLPPGSYTFEVMAANRDGVWSLRPDALRFTIPVAFYQTRRFFALCVFAVLAALALIVRTRVRLATERVRLLFKERMKERERLAQDLHDNLLQDIMGISLQLEVADELTPADAAGKPVLRRALLLTEAALAGGRSALGSLRARALTPGEVAEAIGQAAHRFTGPERLQLRLLTQENGPVLSAETAEDIVQIGREAVANALQHTGGAVAVRIVQSREAFTLLVRDEGLGIRPEVLRTGVPGHFGMQGMRERAARVAARLTVEPAHPKGTLVRLVVPGRTAYRGDEGPQWCVRRLLPSRRVKEAHAGE